MARPIEAVAVLGAGTMGARIAAHCANAGLAVHLLDLPGAAERGLKAAVEGKPAAFFAPELARRIRLGSFDDLAPVAQADWVIEAVVEDLAIKRKLLTAVAPLLAPHAALTTNTSGLPVTAVGAELPPEVKRRWFGTHFFNPPRYLRLLEIIPTADTDRALLETIAEFADRRLGKGVVLAKDTPNFIANRIGTFSMLTVLRLMEEMDLDVEQIDALTGPALGWPKSATFRTADLVGVDLLAHVIENSYQNLAGDEKRELYRVPAPVRALLERGWLGEKSGQGFYRRGARTESGEREILVLDLKTMEYRPRRKPRFPSLDLARTIDDPAERLRAVLGGADAAGQFLWRLLSEVLDYAARRIPEIADQPYEIDRAMRWGFGWQAGPFAMWDALGLEATVARMEKEQRQPAEYVRRLLASGAKSFYRDAPLERAASGREAVSPATLAYAAVPEPEGVFHLDALRRAGREVQRNPGCSLLDLGDGVGGLEFHAKMNAIGADIVALVTQALRDGASRFEAFVIGNEAENFSAGANLMLLLLAIQDEDWDEVELAVRAFQGMTQAIRRSPRPVVAAPFGLTLGGGCEVMLHAAQVTAHAELYAGLVELGVGLIPAGGGTKEMTVRALRAAERVRGPGSRGESVAVQEALKQAFETVAMAKVSTSAVEAQTLAYLSPDAVIVPNRDRVLAVAKEEALRLAREGYRPPAPALVPAAGPNVRATLQMGVYLMRQAGYITDFEQKLANKLAHIMAGGDAPAGAPIGEDYLLDLEREAFLSLCGEAKTRERIQFTLKTGKPLRN